MLQVHVVPLRCLEKYLFEPEEKTAGYTGEQLRCLKAVKYPVAETGHLDSHVDAPTL